jgi:hypothetical protein
MVVADIDFNKAYDSIDRHVKEVALRRLGIGYRISYGTIDYLLEFDRRNVQRVRTYYGDSETFECERVVLALRAGLTPAMCLLRAYGLDACYNEVR